MHLYTVTLKSGPDTFTINVFADSMLEAAENAEIRYDSARAIRVKKAASQFRR